MTQENQTSTVKYYSTSAARLRSFHQFFFNGAIVLGVGLLLSLPTSKWRLRFLALATPGLAEMAALAVVHMDWRFRRAKHRPLKGKVISSRLAGTQTHIYLDSHSDLFVLEGVHEFQLGVDEVTLNLLEKDGVIVEFDYEWEPHRRPDDF